MRVAPGHGGARQPPSPRGKHASASGDGARLTASELLALLLVVLAGIGMVTTARKLHDESGAAPASSMASRGPTTPRSTGGRRTSAWKALGNGHPAASGGNAGATGARLNPIARHELRGRRKQSLRDHRAERAHRRSRPPGHVCRTARLPTQRLPPALLSGETRRSAVGASGRQPPSRCISWAPLKPTVRPRPR